MTIEDIYYMSLDFAPIEEEKIMTLRQVYNELREDIIRKAKKDKMLPFVAKLFIDADIDKEYWNLILLRYRERNEQTKRDLIEVCKAFIEANISDCWPIENFAALIASREDLAMFASGDIDIYVGHKNHEMVDQIMTGLGWTAREKDDQLRYEYEREDREVSINIMWKWQARKKFTLNTCFDKWNIGYNPGGLPPMLSNDELLYLCLLHVATHYYVLSPSIRLYYDIGIICKNCSINWNNIFKYAREDKTVNCIVVAAALAVDCFHVNIPSFVYSDIIKTNKTVRRLYRSLKRKGSTDRLRTGLNGIAKLRTAVCSDDRGALHLLVRYLS